jgi:hypothetical protein
VVEDLIRRVLDGKKHKVTGKKVLLSELEIWQLCGAAKEVFLSQSNLLDFEAPINVCGERSILADVLSCRRGTEECLRWSVGSSCCYLADAKGPRCP